MKGFFYIIPFLSGIMVGSLLNACIYRYCKEKMPVRFPLIEVLNGIGYIFIFIIHGIGVDSICLCLFFSALLVVSIIDWRTFVIPAGVNAAVLVLGAVRTVLDYSHIAEHLIGMVCVSLFLLLLNLFTNGRIMGGGDVKLMAASGLLLGWKQILLALWLGCLTGSVIHLCLMKYAGKGRQLALGPYLSVGLFISMLWGDRMIMWYFG